MTDHKQDIIAVTILICLATLFWLGIAALLYSTFKVQKQPAEMMQLSTMEGNTLMPISVPVYLKMVTLGYREVTAYSSTIAQTDLTPFITADGGTVRKGIVASNEFPFGQRIMIDGIEGIFIVTDRMNNRYKYRIDIWMETEEEAWQFGKQIREIKTVN